VKVYIVHYDNGEWYEDNNHYTGSNVYTNIDSCKNEILEYGCYIDDEDGGYSINGKNDFAYIEELDLIND